MIYTVFKTTAVSMYSFLDKRFKKCINFISNDFNKQFIFSFLHFICFQHCKRIKRVYLELYINDTIYSIFCCLRKTSMFVSSINVYFQEKFVEIDGGQDIVKDSSVPGGAQRKERLPVTKELVAGVDIGYSSLLFCKQMVI